MFFNNNMWPYGKLQYILHQLNLDWLVKQVKQNTDDIEDIREHGSGSCPDITAAATVDSNTGTPSVAVVKTGTDEEPTFTFNFHNLKGAAGADGRDGTNGRDGTDGRDGRDGTDGVTPVISATASVNSSTGTPSVSVTKSGTDAAPSFAFAFRNLKGATGATGPQGPAGSSSGDALPRYNVNNMQATISDDIANAYLNGKVPFYMLLANGGSTSVTKSSINISSTSTPPVTVYCATNPVEVPANDVVLVKFYWNGPDMRFDTVSSGGGGGGGLSTIKFTISNNIAQFYDSEGEKMEESQSSSWINWARRHEPITLKVTSGAQGSVRIGTVDDLTLRGSGTYMMYNTQEGYTFTGYYEISNGYVTIPNANLQNGYRVTLF